MMTQIARFSAALCIPLLLAATHLSAQTYRELTQYKLPAAATSGIAVDSQSRKLFVGTSDGVAVLNADSGASLGNIGGLTHTHDVLLIPTPEGDEHAQITRGFAADAAGHLIAFSTTDLKPIASLKLPTSGAVSLCFDPEANTVEAVSAGGSIATVDAQSNKIIKSGPVQTGAGAIACGILNHVYVADPVANVVRVLNRDTLTVDGNYRMLTGHKPSGLVLEPKGRRLFVSCEDGTIEIIDTDAGFTFIELKGGIGEAHETFAWLPQGKGQWKAAAFIAHDDGTLSAVRMNAFINYSLAGKYKLPPGIRSIAYDEKTHHLFIASSDAAAPAVLVVGYEPVS
jgi:WD40 repeat protein